MTDNEDRKLALFELYLATAEKVSGRRAQANSWMLSVNSASVGLYGYLQAVGAAQKAIWLWAIPPRVRSSARPGRRSKSKARIKDYEKLLEEHDPSVVRDGGGE